MTNWAMTLRRAATIGSAHRCSGCMRLTPIAKLWLAAIACAFASASPALADPADCPARPGTLGVSRVIEVETKDGVRLGNMQYKDIDFLRPGEVVLTFDDGPLRRYSLAVLNALERHCTKATFFMVGRMAVSDPDMVQEIARRGHTVGSHTWSHKNLGRQSQSGAEREIELGISAVSAALGKPIAPFFRFPYLSDPKAMIAHLKERDTAIFSIDVDSNDFRTRDGNKMISNIMSGLSKHGKGILLFHDIQKSTARGIDELLDRLYRDGYKIVHLVPKDPIATLSNYDTDGMKELIARKKANASRPLADRSVVWPISLAGVPDREPLRALPHPVGVKGPVAPETAKLPPRRPETVPNVSPSRHTTANEPAERVSSQAIRPSVAVEAHRTDWRDDIFRN